MMRFILVSVVALFGTCFGPCVAGAYEGAAMRTFENLLANEGYELCGDVWCEGDFDYQNWTASCTNHPNNESSCSISFDMVEYSRALTLRAKCTINKLPTIQEGMPAEAFFHHHVYDPLGDCIEQHRKLAHRTQGMLENSTLCTEEATPKMSCYGSLKFENWDVTCFTDGACRFDFDILYPTGYVPASNASVVGWSQYTQTYEGFIGPVFASHCTFENTTGYIYAFDTLFDKLVECVRGLEKNVLKSLKKIRGLQPVPNISLLPLLHKVRIYHDQAKRLKGWQDPATVAVASSSRPFDKSVSIVAAKDCNTSWCQTLEFTNWNIDCDEEPNGVIYCDAHYNMTRPIGDLLLDPVTKRQVQGQTGLLFSSHFCDIVIDDALPLKTMSPQQFYKDHVRQPLNRCIQKAFKKASLVMSLPSNRTTTVAKGQ